MFNSIIHNISRPFGRGNSNLQSSSGQNQDRNDLEEDGFLVVGNTASERTIVEARNFRSDLVDPPPHYNQASQNYLPTYQDCFSANCGQSPSLNVSQFPGIKHGNPMDKSSPSVSTGFQEYSVPQENTAGFTDTKSRTALSGIPFELCGGLQNGNCLSEFGSSVYQQKQFDYSLYEYDFSLERSFLQEHD